MTEPSPVRAETRQGLIGPFTGRQLAVALGVIAVVAVVLVAITRPVASAPGTRAPLDPAATQYVIGPVVQGLNIGDRAPELTVRGSGGRSLPLTDLAGNPIRLAGLRGHPVWIDFWASWCPPCQAEMPVLRDVYRSYESRGLVLIAISVQETSLADVRAYARRYGLPYTVAADLNGDVFREYRVYGLPTQLFLDADGVIRSVVQGPVDYNTAVANLDLIVPGPAASPSGGPAGSATPLGSPRPAGSPAS